LKLSRSISLKADAFDSLRRAKDLLQSQGEQWNYPMKERPDQANRLGFFGLSFHKGDRQGVNEWTPDPSDLAEILTEIRDGKQRSHFLAAMIHSHQVESDFQRHGDTTPEFLVTVARAAIDNGADVFIGTGPHTLRGIEIYNGKPIFYGLGELFHQLYDSHFPAADRAGITETERAVDFWDKLGSTSAITTEGLIAISKYDQGHLREVRLYPTDARYQAPVVNTGIPRLATPPYAQDILRRVQALSARFGTVIEIEGSVGVIRVAPVLPSAGPVEQRSSGARR